MVHLPQVWVARGNDLEALPEAEHGHFYGSDSYVVLHEYTDAQVGGWVHLAGVREAEELPELRMRGSGHAMETCVLGHAPFLCLCCSLDAITPLTAPPD